MVVGCRNYDGLFTRYVHVIQHQSFEVVSVILSWVLLLPTKHAVPLAFKFFYKWLYLPLVNNFSEKSFFFALWHTNKTLQFRYHIVHFLYIIFGTIIFLLFF